MPTEKQTGTPFAGPVIGPMIGVVLALVILVACSDNADEELQPSAANLTRTQPVSAVAPTHVAATAPTPADATSTAVMGQLDPTTSDLEQTLAIYNAIGVPPPNERYEVTFELSIDSGGRYVVHITGESTDYYDIIQQAQNWFRERAYEPCEGALYATTSYTGNFPLATTLREPCEDTVAQASDWASCRGIVQEPGDELVRAIAGERFCIVRNQSLATFVSIYPADPSQTSEVANQAASYLNEPCSTDVAFFISPDLGRTSFDVKALVCDG